VSVVGGLAASPDGVLPVKLTEADVSPQGLGAAAAVTMSKVSSFMSMAGGLETSPVGVLGMHIEVDVSTDGHDVVAAVNVLEVSAIVSVAGGLGTSPVGGLAKYELKRFQPTRITRPEFRQDPETLSASPGPSEFLRFISERGETF
jgi:hypothetical protein